MRGLTKFCPPIRVKQAMDMMQLIELLKPIANKDFAVGRHQRSSDITVHTFKYDAHKKILKFLATRNIPHYTFTPKVLKRKTLVLKGMRGSSNPAIKCAIDELRLSDVHVVKVSKVVFDKSKPELHHHLVQLSPTSESSFLVTYNKLAGKPVRWEPLRKKELYQCRKCQRLGHTSRNCNLGYRCVKCGGAHGPKLCEIKKGSEDREKFYCVNCKAHGHPASWRGCPFIKSQTTLAGNIKESRAHFKNKKKLIKQFTGLKL